jgi:hypothetical protein
MKWELDALKMLAKNPTVPGIALADAVHEIERLRVVLAKASKRADLAEEIVERVIGGRNPYDKTTDRELIEAWQKAKGGSKP